MKTIIIVDPQPSDRQPYLTLLSSYGHHLLEASNGTEALDLARVELPDLVITDILMPNMDGFSLVRRLRAEPLLSDVSVIFQTAQYRDAEIIKLATDSGVQYILGKPAEAREILKIVNEALQKSTKPTSLHKTKYLQRKHLQLLADKLYEKNLELEKANERLRTLSLTDELTGLNNRRGFMILSTGLLKFARRAKHPLSLLYMDMDSLKQTNDTYGHAQGDLALINFANILNGTFRDSDVIARLGGDEFTILAIDATEEGLTKIQARLKNNVDTYNLNAEQDIPLTFSLGIIRVDLNSALEMEALLSQADEAMYAHKREKRNSTG